MKLFSCLTQLSIEFVMLINVKMSISMINKTSESLKAGKVFIFLAF